MAKRQRRSDRSTRPWPVPRCPACRSVLIVEGGDDVLKCPICKQRFDWNREDVSAESVRLAELLRVQYTRTYALAFGAALAFGVFVGAAIEAERITWSIILIVLSVLLSKWVFRIFWLHRKLASELDRVRRLVSSGIRRSISRDVAKHKASFEVRDA